MQQFLAGPVVISNHTWQFTVPVLQELILLLKKKNMTIEYLDSPNPKVRMIASSLGLITRKTQTKDPYKEKIFSQETEEFIVHRGTLHAGDNLVIPNTVLLLGDVNPGAIISSAGNIMIWGKLRGIAHAGFYGNRKARIVAMHLRPLQVRIADLIARVPDDKPSLGLAEEAQIFEECIRIIPAYPNWNNRS